MKTSRYRAEPEYFYGSGQFALILKYVRAASSFYTMFRFNRPSLHPAASCQKGKQVKRICARLDLCSVCSCFSKHSWNRAWKDLSLALFPALVINHGAESCSLFIFTLKILRCWIKSMICLHVKNEMSQQRQCLLCLYIRTYIYSM